MEIDDDSDDDIGNHRTISKEVVVEMEEILKGVARSILEEWRLRIKLCPLLEASYNAFANNFEIDVTKDQMTAEMDRRLSKVLRLLPEYISFMAMYKELDADLEYHKIYLKWHRMFVAVSDGVCHRRSVL